MISGRGVKNIAGIDPDPGFGRIYTLDEEIHLAGQRAAAPQQMAADESAVRNRVLNEVLDAFSDLDDTAGIEGVLKVIQGLKKKQKAMAEDKSEI